MDIIRRILCGAGMVPGPPQFLPHPTSLLHASKGTRFLQYSEPPTAVSGNRGLAPPLGRLPFAAALGSEIADVKVNIGGD